MVGTSSASLALSLLHYLAPVLCAVYFLAAKTVTVCLLQQPSKRPGPIWRWTILALQAAVVSTTTAECIMSVVRTINQSWWGATKDYVFYLVVAAMLHISLLVGLAEQSKPIWHPYVGTWSVALCFDIGILALQSVHKQTDRYDKINIAFCSLRVAFLLALCIATSWRMLYERRQGIQLDDESEGLLAAAGNGNVSNRNSKSVRSTADSLVRHEQSATNDPDAIDTSKPDSDSDDENDDWDIDSITDEPERDRELKAQQKERLRAAGNWFHYLQEFKIFVPMIFPWDDRLVQLCLVVIGLCLVALRVLNILVPAQLGRITNELTIAAGTGIMPWRAIGLYILYAALSSSAGIPLLEEFPTLLVHQYGYKAITTISFRHIMTLSMDFHNEKSSGELIRAIEQGTNLQELVHFGLFTVCPMLFDLIVAFAYVSYLFDIYMGMVLAAVGFAYIWVGAKTTLWSVKRRRDFNTAWRNESKVQNEAISNWQTVSHFNQGTYESSRYTDSVITFNRAEWRYLATYFLGGGAQNTIMLVGRLAAFSIAAYRVVQGRASVGSFITLVQYWGSIESPLASVTFSIRRLSSMLTDSERLLQLLTTKPSVVDAADAKPLEVREGEVRFDHVDFAYDARRPTLKNIDFVVKPGQTIALVGETGGGKSTILKLLYRYYDVAKGAIRIDGQDLREVTLDSLRDSFGMVPQDPSLFNVSLMENIKYARLDATDEEVKDACRAAAIHDKIESFPDKYKAKVGERGVKLSGGELQRVAIARAILRQPKIVLLDEATSQVDAETEAIIQSAFQRLSAKRTTFVVAHRLSTIQHADLILVIHDGVIVERGTHDELFRAGGKYKGLWSKQLSKEVKDIGAKLDVVKTDAALIELAGEEQSSSLSSSTNEHT